MEKVASLIQNGVRDDVEQWISKRQSRLFLQVVLVGDDPASIVYTGTKTKACADVGIETNTLVLQDTISAKELKETIQNLNKDDSIGWNFSSNAIAISLSKYDVIESIDHRKDVDGFHPMNVGRLSVDQPCFRSCTPAGVMNCSTL